MSRKLNARRRGADRGAVALIVAVVLGAVMLGVLALSVDVGAMTLERRQLQNAADATAMALAQECGTQPTCDVTSVSHVVNLLDANSGADKLSQFDTSTYPAGACGRSPAMSPPFGLPQCASATTTQSLTELANCPPLPDWLIESGHGEGKIPYVETYAKTQTTNGNRLLPFFGPNSSGTSQVSCARAAWGPAKPSSANTLAFTMSECDWASQTGAVIDPATGKVTNTPTFAPSPVGFPGYDYDPTTVAPDWPAVENGVFGKDNPTLCDTSSPGGTAPGGFAWLESTNCKANILPGAWMHTSTGNRMTCSQEELKPLRGTVVYVPIFDCVAGTPQNPIPSAASNASYCRSGNGDGTFYHISGFAAFYLTGWYLGNNADKKMDSIKPPEGRYLCTNPARCFSGWFTKSLISPEEVDLTPPNDGGIDYGLAVVKPAG